jgi:thiol-disulfide isomerase/thioredoxin
VAVVVAVLLGFRLYQQQGIASGAAVPFTGSTVKGRVVALSDFSGRPVVVHFWATWCGVCEAMDDNIQSVARDHRVVTIATGSGTTEEIRDYLSQKKGVAPVLVDPEGGLASRYGVSALPTTFFVDGNGEIRFTEVGYTTEAGLRLRLWWMER